MLTNFNQWFKNVARTFLVLLIPIILVACQTQNNSASTSNNDSKPLKVVTTFYPMYEFTKQVVGDHGDVEVLIEGQTEPHDYEPTPKDLQKIIESDVFVYNSNYMETWVPEVLKHIDSNQTTVVNASSGIQLKSVIEDEMDDHDDEVDEHHEDADDHHHGDEDGHHHEFDPHIWLSPVLAQQEVSNIAAGLIEADASNKQTYEENADRYINALQDLDAEYRNAFEDAQNKVFVTQHQAFSYLADAYGLTQIPIAGINPEIEPSPAQLAQLKQIVEQYDIHIIFSEDSASSKVAETLSNELNLKLEVLSPLESLSKDDQDNHVTYIEKMEQNLDALKLVIK